MGGVTKSRTSFFLVTGLLVFVSAIVLTIVVVVGNNKDKKNEQQLRGNDEVPTKLPIPAEDGLNDINQPVDSDKFNVFDSTESCDGPWPSCLDNQVTGDACKEWILHLCENATDDNNDENEVVNVSLGGGGEQQANGKEVESLPPLTESNIFIIPQDSMVTGDYLLSRVRIYVDIENDNLVSMIPERG